MKQLRIINYELRIACLLLIFAFFCLDVSNAQEFRRIHDGIEHAQFTRQVKTSETESHPVVINAMRLDLKKTRLDVVHAMDAAIGLERTSSIAARHGALAAINAGFFRIDNSIFRGDAVSVLKINHKLLSESYANRIALFISNLKDQTAINFAHLNINDLIEIKNKTFRLSGINRQRKDDEIIEYTSDFHRTTLTENGGLEIIVRNGKIVAINDGKGSSLIPENGYVISAGAKMRGQLLPLLKIGNKVKLSTGVLHEGNAFPTEESNRTTTAFSTAEDIIGGVPQLIKNGKIEITWQAEKIGEKFVTDRHPRTAIAKLKDGRALLIAVDGRQPDVSVGMSLPELAEILLEMGATHAMNLDGGGSTTMFLDGKVVNRPSDKEGERAVSDAILVFPRDKK